MGEVSVAMREGGTAHLAAGLVDALRADLRGHIVARGDRGYSEARSLWNAMIDRHPALIVRCAGPADVMRTVRFAREHDLLLAVRGGGHNIAGSALCDGGLVIDLSQMRGIRVDPRERVARVEAGATLADFDAEAQVFGLATPLGINATTGVAGLTLGGGFGWLSRRYGLTVDNLRSADVVLASGELVHASEQDAPDLYWAIRGGGGNFGVVTSFEFTLHPVGPMVLAGLIVHRLEDADHVLKEYRSFAAGAPEELACWLVLRKAPPLPFLPAEIHGREVIVIAVMHVGDLAAGERLVEPLRRMGRPVGVAVGPQRFVDWERAFDPLLTPGARNYWKSHNFTTFSDGALDTMADFARRLPSPQTELIVGQLGGAIGRVGPDETAYPHRDANFVLNVHTRWTDPADDRRCIDWARECFQALAPFAAGGVYVNFISEGDDRVGAAFGANYDRLAAIKARYDPTNVFRTNQNIAPTPVATAVPASPPEGPSP